MLGRLALLLMACALAAAGTAVAQPSQGSTVVAKPAADWKVVCDQSSPGTDQRVCGLRQTLFASDKTNLSITIEKFADGKLLLRVVAPLDVLLPAGLGLSIDGQDVGRAPFVRCYASGCFAQMIVDGPLAERLKAGKTAVFSIARAGEPGIAFPVSLASLSQALAGLEPRPVTLR
jgi:invasion protein IalB